MSDSFAGGSSSNKQETKPDQEKEPQKLGRSTLDGLTILLIEDTSDALVLHSQLLLRAGANILQASSVSEAWKVLANSRPDVIVSDIAMPDEDGICFVKQLREKTGTDLRLSEIPAIALTAFTDRVVRSVSLKAGFQDYLCKPVSYTELVQAVLRLVDPTGTTFH